MLKRQLINVFHLFLTSKYLDDIELLVINDGSTDKTAEIVSQYQEKFPNSIKLVNKENGGYGSTINTSLQIATGKYYKTIDGDDWVHADELDCLIECLRKTSLDRKVKNLEQCRTFYYRRFTCDRACVHVINHRQERAAQLSAVFPQITIIPWAEWEQALGAMIS